MSEIHFNNMEDLKGIGYIRKSDRLVRMNKVIVFIMEPLIGRGDGRSQEEQDYWNSWLDRPTYVLNTDYFTLKLTFVWVDNKITTKSTCEIEFLKEEFMIPFQEIATRHAYLFRKWLFQNASNIVIE